MNGALVTVLFGVLPVLAFVGLAVRSTLGGGSAEPGGSAESRGPSEYAAPEHRGQAEQHIDPRRGDG